MCIYFFLPHSISDSTTLAIVCNCTESPSVPPTLVTLFTPLAAWVTISVFSFFASLYPENYGRIWPQTRRQQGRRMVQQIHRL
mmetsp:Transcript_17230/g.36001  ORF Transcript_17230/g.36001 Transcript_17230/m.36001 type:complete len:83 (-) Transcript_17230:979-1227(-)